MAFTLAVDVKLRDDRLFDLLYRARRLHRVSEEGRRLLACLLPVLTTLASRRGTYVRTAPQMQQLFPPFAAI